MTLITNEIYTIDGFRKTAIVFAADRRITGLDGKFAGNRRKLFPIPYMRAGVSYFGVALVFPGGRPQHMSDWLQAFIRQNADIRVIGDFARELRSALNRVAQPKILEKHPSGFHICGYNAAELPEFWGLSNIGGMEGFQYVDLRPEYSEPIEDFLRRDARNIGWDGANPSSVQNGAWIYRNGDFRAHVYLWTEMDRFLGTMRQFQDFRIRRISQEEWVKFKFEVIAHFYKKFANQIIIGRPIDVFTIGSSLP